MATTSRYVKLSVFLIPFICVSQSQAISEAMLWPTNSLAKVMRTDAPTSRSSNLLLISGARGETVSAQAAFRPAKDANAASVSISDLRHTEADTRIPCTSVRLQWARYIDIGRNTFGIPEDELVAKAPTSIPDPFWEDAVIPVKAHQAEAIWIEVRIPRHAEPGDYEGKLTLAAAGQSFELPIRLHVWDFEMPRERHQSVINWWSFPGLRFEHVKPYTEEYWQLLQDCCAFVVDHRQTDVSASINLIQESTADREEHSYDTSRLERYAEVAFGAGIRRIHLHSVGRRTANHIDPNSRIIANESGLRRLAMWEKVVQRRNWQNRFLVGISDEPLIHHEESYAAMVERVHRIAPSIRCIEAVETEYLGKLDVYVPKLSQLSLRYPHFRQVQNEGAELWFYTCCHPVGRYPNRFLDQSLLKVRVLHWLNYLYDLDGYLHWGLNRFAGEDPYTEEGLSKGLPLGDRAIAYPGTRGLLGSLRLSAMRDGLQDFECLWVLENKLSEIKSKVGQEAFWLDPRQRPLELCRRVAWSFHDYTRDSNVLLSTREVIAAEIEGLQTEPLLIVQTSPPEGTVIPAGPRPIGVRGLVPPGAKVALNGKPLQNVRPSGYFLTVCFLPDKKPTITITVEHKGKQRSTERTFKFTD